MRILMLVQDPKIKGPLPKHTPLLVEALRSLECEVITSPWGRHSDYESLVTKMVGRARDIIRARKTLREKPFDVLVVKTAHDWRTLLRDLPLLLVTRRLCPVIVLQFHGSFSDQLVAPGFSLFKIASTWLIRLSDAALLLSLEERNQWQQFYPDGNFFVVANPYLPNADLQLRTSTLSWALPHNKPILVFVGTLKRAKGILDLLRAMPIILERNECHLLVAGDGSLARQVQELIARLELTDHVTLTGYLREEQLAEAYQIAHTLILPTYWAEGFPTVITEAMDAGLPIITTRIRGAADYLKHGINGLFIPPRDPTAIANAVELLLSDPPLCAKMAQINQEKVKDFTPEIVGRQYLNVIEEIFRSRKINTSAQDSHESASVRAT